MEAPEPGRGRRSCGVEVPEPGRGRRRCGAEVPEPGVEVKVGGVEPELCDDDGPAGAAGQLICLNYSITQHDQLQQKHRCYEEIHGFL